MGTNGNPGRRGRQAARSALAPLYQRVADSIVARLAPEIARLGATLDAKVAEMHTELDAHMRAETGELARMLRLQGDADDELAATLGRTLARVSAEVEALSLSVARLEAARASTDPEPADVP